MKKRSHPLGPGGHLGARAVRLRRRRRAIRCPAAGTPGGSAGSEVIVGSADFTESQLIASIYSQALQAAGVKSRNSSTSAAARCTSQALKDGSID